MQAMTRSYQAVSLLLGLNWDRFFSIGAIALGLLAGAFLGDVLINL
jgi:hypothetical protein